MKTVSCRYEHCGARRIHWERPDVKRGTQTFDVPDEQEGPAYCSLECAILAGAIKINMGPGSTALEA